MRRRCPLVRGGGGSPRSQPLAVGSRSSENIEEQLENALQALSQIQGGETASDKLQSLEEQLDFSSQYGSIVMQTLFAPQIEEAVL